MNKSTRAAAFIFGSLMVALILGGCAAWRSVTSAGGVALLVACVFAAVVLGVAALVVLGRFHKSAKLAEYGVPLPLVARVMTRRQWLTLLFGLITISLLTGTVAGASVAFGPPVAQPVPPAAPVTPALGPTPTVTAAPTPPSPPPSSASPAGSPDTSGSPSGSASTSDGPPPPGSVLYLDTMDLVTGSAQPAAVDLSAKRYPRSITFYCVRATQTVLQWNVAGSARFRATAGVSDNTDNSFGLLAEMIFYDQDGHQLVPAPVDVSVGHPQVVEIDLTRVVNLRMTCSGRDSKTNAERYTYGTTLADAVLIKA